MAANKIAYQSSTHNYNFALYAVDTYKTIRNRMGGNKMTSMTQDEPNPWWTVYLGEGCVVDRIEITFGAWWKSMSSTHTYTFACMFLFLIQQYALIYLIILYYVYGYLVQLIIIYLNNQFDTNQPCYFKLCMNHMHESFS